MTKSGKTSKKLRNVALIVAAGKGSRFGGKTPKQYLKLFDKTVLRQSIEEFSSHSEIDAVRVVILPEHKKHYQEAVRGLKILPPVMGDKNYRQQSVRKGLESFKNLKPENILIHDAARPMVSQKIISSVIKKLQKHVAVIPIMPVNDTIKKISGAKVQSTIPRENLVYAQTPQGFDFLTILNSHHKNKNKIFSDDASLLEAEGIKITTVKGEENNFKITSKDDLMRAKNLFKESSVTKVGFGIDAHAFGKVQGHGYHVMLCGIPVVFARELIGHSDGDVGLHAIVDSILGALGEGDIGEHFPSGDKKLRGADSAIFIKHANKLLREKHGKIVHVDVTIIAESLKVSPHRDAMRDRIANLLNLPKHSVSVKATSTDKLGFIGRDEGIAAQAVTTIQLTTKE